MGPATYQSGFAPRDGSPAFPELWRSNLFLLSPGLGPSGTVIRDNGPTKRILTIAGTGTLYAPVGRRYALLLDGNGRASSATGFQNAIGTGNFTSAVWVRPTTLGISWQNTFGLNNGPTYGMYQDGSGSQWCLWVGSRIDSGVTLTVGVWTHLCAVRRSGTVYLYTNGKQTASAAMTLSIPSTFTLIVGSESSGSQAAAMRGALDDAGMWQTAFTPDDVRKLALRPGIMHELAPRRRGYSAVAFNRRRRLLVGAGS